MASSAHSDTDVKTQLAAILQSIVITPPNAFEFAGKQFVQDDENAAIQSLKDSLYQHCYCRRFEGVPAENPAGISGSLWEELSAANAGRPHWETGWEVFHVDASGSIMAQKNGVSRTFWPGEFVTYDGPGAGPRISSRVDVYFATESRNMQPGFYFAFGETFGEDPDSSDLVRFYWDIEAAGAVPLTRGLTRALNRFQVPFRFKCLNDRGVYGRLDPAVLFINRRYFRIAADLIAPIREELAEHLRPDTPLFTKRLAPGLGFAEDPGDGGSFGMHRCRLLAEAIWREPSIDGIVKAFESNGISIDRPYLNTGSIDQYELR